MSIKLGINGFGRMGRLTLRAALKRADLADAFVFVGINAPAAVAAIGAFRVLQWLPRKLAFESISQEPSS